MNGEDVLITPGDSETLRDARDRALAESRNTGRPVAEWEVRGDSGALLDLASPALAMADKRAFITLHVGHLG